MREQQRPAPRWVIKVGSSVLTDAIGRLQRERLDRLADQLVACAASGRQPILVSSGAIACGMARLGLTTRPKALAQLQACAAIGQGELMHLYTEAFARHRVTTAQVLLTQDDLANRERFRNAKQTLLTLLHKHVVPIINENDTVSVEEITFGDNDRLAAVVSSAVDAQLLVLLSDVDGFIRDGRVVERVESVSGLSATPGLAKGRHTTKGGMSSKLEAARIVGHSGIPMVIANGLRDTTLADLVAGKPIGTLFLPPRTRLNAKKWWIAFALRTPNGRIVIDAGAAEALSERGKSLLASGVVGVEGQFGPGAFVAIIDRDGHELARGVSEYGSDTIQRIQGMKSADAALALGARSSREVVHRNHLVLAQELTHGR